MDDTLCRPCAGLDMYGAVQRLLLSRKGTQTSESFRLVSPWHRTLADVDVWSSSCALCAAIMRGWQSSREVVVEQAVRNAMFDPEDPPPGLNHPVDQIQEYRDASGITIEVVRRTRTVDDGRANRSSIFLQVKCRPGPVASFDVLDAVMAELRITRESHGPVTPDAADTVSKMIGLHTDLVVSSDPLSQESLHVARGWLETCVNSHGAACSPPTAVEEQRGPPTRLLEVVPGSNKIYLRESLTLQSTGDARYVALSHCWGQAGTPFTTTHQTLPLRMDGIAVDTLPCTFRDAVALVECLGLRYLWIDSLCIIQDDAEDWAREAAQMANVYRNAHLVINAANSDADKTGFLRPRGGVSNMVRLPPLSAPGSKLQLYLQLLPPEGRRWSDPATGPDNLSGEPISSRAWCLQERSLPVRALQYGSHQTFWECERMRASEDGDAVLQDGGGGGHLKRLCKTGNMMPNRSVFAPPDDDREPDSELEQKVNWVDWYRMVEDYTARRITKHTDRLPALSGLAQAVARDTGAEYLAGSWKSGLLEGLLWCRAQPGGHGLTATPEYVAPSWSWASVVGAVQFPIYTWYTQRARWKGRMADFEPLADYLEHSVVKRDLDPYGRLERGLLSLRAPLLSVLGIQPRLPQAPTLHSLFGQAPSRSEVADIVVQLKTGSRTVWIEGGFDNPVATRDATKLFVMFLARLPHVLEKGFVEHRFGLLLERLDGGGKQYRRVGFVDGVILKKSIRDIFKGRGMDSIVGYPRPYEEGDIDQGTRDNDLASDPLMLGRDEVTIC
ncbi:a97f8ef6-a9b0-4f8b-8fdf-2c72f37eda9e [Chaetomidium leptoderma]|uniref:A97f8ef6-a9b0-4f8b-8fdf-2c72f37eda9e n=1 Tax=Chaetomidium leptoderma TaxID=669021 RepID=A0AAN6VTE1_9PEZI|nr:a97f8ef6-a9b0-4f8b-8fdf-2c72f37eda9e [Chaetomidium leptoderma]